MVAYLFLAFIVVPVLEIFLITQVASQLSWLPTIALVIGVSMVGAWLVKREGTGVINRVRESLNAGQMPTNELADGAMIFFASALMLTPGFLTDFVGLALLIPPIRALLRPPVVAFFKKRIDVRTGGLSSVMFGGTGSAAGAPGAGSPFGASRRPGFGRDVFDVDADRAPVDADLTDITREPPELDNT